MANTVRAPRTFTLCHAARCLVATAAMIFIAGCAVPRSSVTQLIPRPPAVFMVSYPMKFSTSTGQGEIVVPVGFITDLASIPRGLWWWQSPQEATMGPAILHDYLYWDQSCSKEEADAALYVAMLQVGMRTGSAMAIYEGVHVGGNGAWNENQERRSRGESRFFTGKYAHSLQEAPVDPTATLTSLQSAADKAGGMVRPPYPNSAVRKACAAWLKEYVARTAG